MKNLYLLLLVAFAGWLSAGNAGAQCTNLFISEYIEGSSNNKVLEIFNPTSEAVDLSRYTLASYTNGSTSATNSLNWPAGTLLAAGEVYVVANSQADSVFLAQADTTSTVTFYNGDDAIVLTDDSLGVHIDIIGVIGVDPGSSWPVGSGSTVNTTLVRKPSVNEGVTDWGIGVLGWEAFPTDFADSLGFHNINNCDPVNLAAASFETGTSSGVEGLAGNDTVYIELTDIATAFTLNLEILAGSTATEGTDFTLANGTGSFAIGIGQTELAVPFTILDDSDEEGNEYFTLKISEAPGGLTIGVSEFTYTIIDDDGEPTPPCLFPFFSEYVEGSSNNKLLEIYNPTDGDLELEDYRIERYTNGSATVSASFTWPAGATLAPGEVYVIANASADSALLALADTADAITNYNGDDAMALVYAPDGRKVDLIGVIGEDPGTSWPVGGGATANNTLVRDPSVNGGQTNWYLAAQTWLVYPIDFADSLGAHYMIPCSFDPACDTTEINLGATTVQDESVQGANDGAIDLEVSGGLPPYSFAWSNGSDSEDLAALEPGLYSVIVTDANGCLSEFTEFEVLPGAGPCDTVTITIAGSVTDESAAGAGDGAIDITVSGGTAPYTFDWSNGSDAKDLTGLDPDTYTVTVTDSLGCTGTASFTVAPGADPCDGVVINIAVSKEDESAAGAGDGSIDLTVTGGTPPYTFDWSNGDDTEDISGLDPDTYTVTVTDSAGCTGTATVTILAGPTAVNDIASLRAFDIYPNPAGEVFSLALAFDRPERMVLSAADLAGRVVHTEVHEAWQSGVIAISQQWEPGIYFVTVRVGDAQAVRRVAIF